MSPSVTPSPRPTTALRFAMARVLPFVVIAGLAPACVSFLDPLAPLSEDAGGGDAGDPDAGSGSACADGEVTAATCGNCGSMTVTCVSGLWVYGACLGEGECAWGDEEVCGGDRAGTRVCGAACSWGRCDDPHTS